MNDQSKIRAFMLEFQFHSTSHLHLKDFQLLWSNYMSLHKLRTPYAFPTVHYLELDEILTQKIIILDAETSSLPTRKLQLVNAYGTRNILKEDIRLHFNCESYFSVHVFYTCKPV